MAMIVVEFNGRFLSDQILPNVKVLRGEVANCKSILIGSGESFLKLSREEAIAIQADLTAAIAEATEDPTPATK